MSGYVEGGYLVALSVLGTYASTLIMRERCLRARVVRDKRSATDQPPTRDEVAR